jgi:pyrrolidone-carboxylate peptidase
MKNIIEINLDDTTSVLVKKINQNNQAMFLEIKRIQAALEKLTLNVHSLKMPDNAGSCSDHDKRYYTKAEINALLP